MLLDKLQFIENKYDELKLVIHQLCKIKMNGESFVKSILI